MTRAEVEAWAEEAEVGLCFYDGFDDALIGIGQRFNSYFLVYDRAKVLRALLRQGMTEEEALEWFEFNVVGGWVGEATPCFVMTGEDDGDRLQ